MHEQQFWVGLDLGQNLTNICVIDKAGDVLLEEACPTRVEDLHNALSQFELQRIGAVTVEAGSDTHAVRKLLERGYPVQILEARKASKFLAIRRNKTDSGDAKGLADIGRLGQATVTRVYLKSLECQELRSKIVLRHKLVRLRVSAEDNLRSRFRMHGRRLRMSNVPGALRMHAQRHFEELRAAEGIDLQPDLGPLVELCEGLRTYLATISRELATTADAIPVCKRFMEVPGVGPICALSFYTAIEDPDRFAATSDVGAYLGLTPRRYQSGDYSITRGITKTGSSLTRTHLVGSAMILKTRGPDCALRRWGLDASERIGPMRSNVALARKLSIVLLSMWKNGTRFDPGLGSVAQTQSRSERTAE
jgi:transposase